MNLQTLHVQRVGDFHLAVGKPLVPVLDFLHVGGVVGAGFVLAANRDLKILYLPDGVRVRCVRLQMVDCAKGGDDDAEQSGDDRVRL